MNKATILQYFVTAVLLYYLIKGICYIALWQGLITLEDRAKKSNEKKNIERKERLLRKASQTF